MFNSKRRKIASGTLSDLDLLKKEMEKHHIFYKQNRYYLEIGDENAEADSLSECRELINEGTNELRKHLWSAWKDLAELAEDITEQNSTNEGSIDNIFFLNSVKKSFLLSKVFTDLDEITAVLHKVFNLDVSRIDPSLISKFNTTYIKVRLLHRLVLSELYRDKIIRTYMQLTKEAQVSGPWANLDLPLAERVWPFDSDEEYFQQRGKSRKEQIRYNPEYNKNGYYFVWQDLNLDPFSFDDMQEESPYKGRRILQIAGN